MTSVDQRRGRFVLAVGTPVEIRRLSGLSQRLRPWKLRVELEFDHYDGRDGDQFMFVHEGWHIWIRLEQMAVATF